MEFTYSKLINNHSKLTHINDILVSMAFIALLNNGYEPKDRSIHIYFRCIFKSLAEIASFNVNRQSTYNDEDHYYFFKGLRSSGATLLERAYELKRLINVLNVKTYYLNKWHAEIIPTLDNKFISKMLTSTTNLLEVIDGIKKYFKEGTISVVDSTQVTLTNIPKNV